MSAEKLLLGEPLIAKVVNAPAGARLIWQIPNRAMVLQYSTDSSMIKLVYTAYDKWANNAICVKVYTGGDMTVAPAYCQTPEGKDEYFTPPSSLPGDRIKSLAGDQLTLHPYFHGDSTLSFMVSTSSTYSCFNSYILYENASDKNKVSLSFNNLWLRDACQPVNLPAVSTCYTRNYYKDGTYLLEITFNKKVYQGSLTVSKFQGLFEYNWPYTEGVIIEPKVIGR